MSDSIGISEIANKGADKGRGMWDCPSCSRKVPYGSTCEKEGYDEHLPPLNIHAEVNKKRNRLITIRDMLSDEDVWKDLSQRHREVKDSMIDLINNYLSLLDK